MSKLHRSVDHPARSAVAPPNVGLLLLLAAIIYGGIFPLNRLAAIAEWPPFGFAIIPTLIAGSALFLIAAAAGKRPPGNPRYFVGCALIGALSFSLPTGLLVNVSRSLPASTLTLILCLAPTFTLIIAAATRSERINHRVVAGMLLGLAGVALIVWPESGIIPAAEVRLFLLALLAPLMFALSNNCAVWLRPEATPAIFMAAGTLIGSGLIAIVISLIAGTPLLPQTFGTKQALPMILATVIYGSFLWLFFILVASVGPSRFSIFNYLAVAAGIIWSMIWFDESVVPMFWVSVALMILGMHVAMRPAWP